jgi:CRP/FNR family transcriptional regulator, cyclic AMP receptor protein
MGPPLVNSFDIKDFFASAKCDRRITQYRKNQVIFSQGDRSEALFYIENGAVKLTVVSKEGKEAIVSVASSGSFFGESCISLDHPVRFQSAIALTNVQLVKIDASLLKQMILAGGSATLKFVALLVARNVRIQTDLANRLVDPSEESLARVISSLVEFRDRQGRTPPPKISQQALAEMIGISRQHVNALMKRLKEARSSTLSAAPSSKSSPPSDPGSEDPVTVNSDVVQQRERRKA